MKVSIVIPVYNEEENIGDLLKEIIFVDNFHEIIIVNDGSTDQTKENLNSFKDNHGNDIRNIKIISFKRNQGQTAALLEGIRKSTGDVIVTMDGDRQNDPKDIPRLIEKLNEGYDCVSGWRANRKDTLSKKVLSKLANWLTRKLIGLDIHDSGCSLKAYKKEALESIEIYGEQHRYIAQIVFQKGYKVGEVEVNHRPRIKGKTKYNFKRIIKGFLDLLFLSFWGNYSARPLHFFGLLGLIQYGLAFVIFIEQVIKAIFFTGKLEPGTLLLFSVLLILNGSLFICIGFLGEMIMRIYFKDKDSYEIESFK